MKIASYVMTTDSGFAPNPFYGYCTLGACTPNHRPYRIDPGDWIVGTSTAATGNRLIYAMRVSEVLDHHEYYSDSRFARKKPRLSGSWKKRCGDNIYYRDSKGRWVSEACVHHTEPAALEKDTKYSKVYISKEFYYFGEGMIEIPKSLEYVAHSTQGLKYVRDWEQVQAFVDWLTSNYSPGIHGSPRHRDEDERCRPKKRRPAISRPARSC